MVSYFAAQKKRLSSIIMLKNCTKNWGAHPFWSTKYIRIKSNHVKTWYDLWITRRTFREGNKEGKIIKMQKQQGRVLHTCVQSKQPGIQRILRAKMKVIHLTYLQPYVVKKEAPVQDKQIWNRVHVTRL